MKRSFLSLSLSVASLLGPIALTGCSGFNNIATSGPLLQQVAVEGVSGSNFGGHAPVVGADVYVLQLGVATGTFGATATSLLTSSTPGASNANANADGAPSSAYYVTTASDGSFAVSNYSCTVGYPVYLAAVGGSTLPLPGFAVSSVSISNSTAGSTPPSTSGAVATWTIPGNTPGAILNVGQTVNLTFPSGLRYATTTNGIGGFFTIFSYSGTVTAFTPAYAGSAGSFTTAFTEVNDPPTGGPSTYSLSGATASSPSAPNPSIDNVLVLGNCPASGNFYTGSTKIRYVYMNEVSTAATALALSGFTAVPGLPFNIGIPTNPNTGSGPDPLALVGAENAANNAGQLYDITGGNQSTTYQGEGHIARAITPAGNGVVPQLLLNTLGNILASCVDSVNPGGSTYSSQCSTLFASATSNGLYSSSSPGTGGVPKDIFTAAVNIARYPAGPSGTSTTGTSPGSSGYFLTSLYNLQGTNYPFAPNLTAVPNDFTAAILYPLASGTGYSNISTGTTTVANPVSSAQSIGIDADGSVWIDAAGTKQIVKFSPLGVPLYQSPSATYSYGYLSVGPAGDIIAGTAGNTGPVSEFFGSGSSYMLTTSQGPGSAGSPDLNGFVGAGIFDGDIALTDYRDDIFVTGTPPTGGNYNSQWDVVNFVDARTSGIFGVGSTYVSIPAFDRPTHGAVDSNGYLWYTTTLANSNTQYFAVTRTQNSGGSESTGFPVTNGGPNGVGGTKSTLISYPQMPAIDNSGNLWVANEHSGRNGSIIYINPTPDARSGLVAPLQPTTNGVISGPYGVAVDGANNVWVTNRSSGIAIDTGLIQLSANTFTLLSPSNTDFSLGFGTPGTNSTMPAPLNVVVDLSGAVWMTSYDSSVLMELLGPGTPTYNPISTASGTTSANKLGTTP